MRKIFLYCIPTEFMKNNVMGYALAEDGVMLATHISSSVDFCKRDLGHTSNNKHDLYRRHFPKGYELVWLDKPTANQEFANAYVLCLEKNHQQESA